MSYKVDTQMLREGKKQNEERLDLPTLLSFMSILFVNLNILIEV